MLLPSSKTVYDVLLLRVMCWGPKYEDFWPIIKPFLSKKGEDGGAFVVLSEKGKVVSDVCSIFNDFFCECVKIYRYRGDTL